MAITGQKYKDSDKFTLYLFGDANSTVYKSKVVSKKTLKKYHNENNKILKDVAGILPGMHKDVKSFEFDDKVLSSSLKLREIID